MPRRIEFSFMVLMVKILYFLCSRMIKNFKYSKLIHFRNQFVSSPAMHSLLFSSEIFFVDNQFGNILFATPIQILDKFLLDGFAHNDKHIQEQVSAIDKAISE